MPFLALVPKQVWIGLAIAVAAVGAYWKITSDAESRGAATVTVKIQEKQIDAQERAETERRKLDRGDDSGVRGFDRD
jgi:hypothetical protein